LLNFGHGFGHVQQGLGGDAAPQQAHAAQTRLDVDQGDLHAQIGGQEGSRVSARASANHRELCIHEANKADREVDKRTRATGQ